MIDQPSSRKAKALVPEELYFDYQKCDRWAIIVGISQYQYQGWNLNYADRDAEELYNLLLTPNGGNFKPEFICKLTNEQATTANITRALRSFLKKPGREDLVLIYFACHGTPDFDRPENVYLLTYDTNPQDIAGTALPMREIDLSLRENLHAEKVIILADTCHSAAIGGKIGRRSTIDDATLINRYLQELSQARGGIALLTSAEANEVSYEDAKWGGGHGVFTYYLLEGMRGAGDLDKNNIVTVGELFEYIRENVKRETNYNQHPAIGTNAYDRNLPVAVVDANSFVEVQNSDRDLPPISALENNLRSAENPNIEQYKEAVIAICRRGYTVLSSTDRLTLESLLNHLNLPSRDAVTIENEVLSKFRQYEKALLEQGLQAYPINEDIQQHLNQIQQLLELADNDVAEIKKNVFNFLNLIKKSSKLSIGAIVIFLVGIGGLISLLVSLVLMPAIPHFIYFLPVFILPILAIFGLVISGMGMIGIKSSNYESYMRMRYGENWK
ncbi:MAG TPA: caspase family protein [Leptolyngbyaceae cyanobacterium]